MWKVKNQQYSRKKCKECCNLLPGHCYVTQHNHAKVFIQSQHIANLIDEKMQQKSGLWICNNGGSNPGAVRRVKPLKWVTPFFLLLVDVEIANKNIYIQGIKNCWKKFVLC
jgi:hypothetical protein